MWEEARKSWDYIISDELIYFGEEFKRDILHRVGRYAKRYAEGNFQIDIVFKFGREMCAKAPEETPHVDDEILVGNAHGVADKNGSDCPMLIKTTNIEENTQ